MKQLFKDITERLDGIAELNWVDEEKGQMNYTGAYDRPPLVFPAALVTLSIPGTQGLNDKKQIAQLQLAITLCFDFSGNTNSKTPTVERDKSLAYYDVVDAVYKALQGWSSGRFNPLDRISFRPIPRPDGYKTVQLVFASGFKDHTAAD
ncbi:hypothetical protein [Croceivirga sp. JEA036]|uniref:hypothetical protein n=1 Tax=Croceivirga sp. JEA036 TaxID=2721162 RepID=UPI001438ADDF|nr:hypothetical protein [Croceivirga sp. JEA036]NJB36378.1 hypothetical protein [Croceivirga sp. JEA036]